MGLAFLPDTDQIGVLTLTILFQFRLVLRRLNRRRWHFYCLVSESFPTRCVECSPNTLPYTIPFRNGVITHQRNGVRTLLAEVRGPQILCPVLAPRVSEDLPLQIPQADAAWPIRREAASPSRLQFHPELASGRPVLLLV